MSSIGIWDLSSGQPERLQHSSLKLERDLEEWIEQDPSLLSHGMVIVGRQVSVTGGFMDLLGIEPSGNWAVIEIKRDELRRDTVAQAFDYASSIAKMSTAEIGVAVEHYLAQQDTSLSEVIQSNGRIVDDPGSENVTIYVVGTWRDEHLERMASFLSTGFRINIVTFDIFEGSKDQRCLARDLTELDVETPVSEEQQVAQTQRQKTSVEELQKRAEGAGIGAQFQLLYEAGLRHGLYPRLYAHSIMFTSPVNKTKMPYTFWVKPEKGQMVAWVSSKTFAEFYPISEADAQKFDGEDRRNQMDLSDAEDFVKVLDEMFASMNLEV